MSSQPYFLDTIRTLNHTMRSNVKLLGLEACVPQNGHLTNWIECDGYRVENVVFESRPDHHVTGNLYISTDGKRPFPAVLVACGHSANGKAYEMYQAVTALLERNGMVALCFDPICQGERASELADARRRF